MNLNTFRGISLKVCKSILLHKRWLKTRSMRKLERERERERERVSVRILIAFSKNLISQAKVLQRNGKGGEKLKLPLSRLTPESVL